MDNCQLETTYLEKNSRHEFLPHSWEFCCSKVPFHCIAAGFNTMQWGEIIYRQSHYIEVAQGGVSNRAILYWLWI